MTAKEYLNQARHLDALINCRLREIDYWRDFTSSVSGSNFEQHYNPNKPTEAPFVDALRKSMPSRGMCGKGGVSGVSQGKPSMRQSTVLPAVRSSWYSATATWITAPGRRYHGC